MESTSIYATTAFAVNYSDIEVGTWGNFCKGAFTHTFDDTTTNQTNGCESYIVIPVDKINSASAIVTITGTNTTYCFLLLLR